MGSFDMACSISGLSLHHHQPTRLFFIIEDPRDMGMCYPTDLYKFCSFGIDATYDDYGQYKIDTNQASWKVFREFIRLNGVYVKKGENPYHDLEFDPKNDKHFKLEYLFDLMYHKRVLFKRHDGTNGVVYPWPVHARILKEICCPPKRFKELCEVFDKEVDEAIKHDFKFWKEYLAKDLKAGKITKAEYRERMRNFRTSPRVPDAGIGSGYCMVGGQHNSNQRCYAPYFFDVADDHGREFLRDALVEQAMVFTTLMRNRIMMVPVMSAGQEPDFDGSAKFHSKVAEIATDIDKHLYE